MRPGIDDVINEAVDRELRQMWRETLRDLIGALLVGAITALALLFSAGCAPSLLDYAETIRATQAKYDATPGDDAHAALDDLRGRLDRAGITIAPLPAEFDGYGMAQWQTRTIYLNLRLPINALFETLCHEAAHLLQPRGLSDAVGQVFAESVAERVARHYGYPYRQHSAQWLAREYKPAFPAVRALRVDVEYAVRVLIGREPFPVQ